MNYDIGLCEGMLNTLFLPDNKSVSQLLEAYCNVLIKGVELEISKVYAKHLVKYFIAYGTFDTVVKLLSEYNIVHTQDLSLSFRSNSAFTRMYFDYLPKVLKDYLSQTIGHMVSELISNEQYYFEPIDPENCPDENILFENLDTIISLLDILGERLLSCLSFIPANVSSQISTILGFVKQKGSEEQRFVVFKTIFFLRFLFPSLNNLSQYLPSTLQRDVTKFEPQITTLIKFGQIVVNGRKSSDPIVSHVINASYKFDNYVHDLFDYFKTSRFTVDYQTPKVDIDQRNEMTEEMLQTLNSSKKMIYEYLNKMNYTDTYNKLNTILEMNKVADPLSLEILSGSSSLYHSFIMKRIEEKEHENYVLRKKIEVMKKRVLRLQTIILIYSKHDNTNENKPRAKRDIQCQYFHQTEDH